MEGRDFHIVNHGSIVDIYAESDPAKEWVKEHVPDHSNMGSDLLVRGDHRCIIAIAEAMFDEGLYSG